MKAALETVDLLVINDCSTDKERLKIILQNHFKAALHFGIFFFFSLYWISFVIISMLIKHTYYLVCVFFRKCECEAREINDIRIMQLQRQNQVYLMFARKCRIHSRHRAFIPFTSS